MIRKKRWMKRWMKSVSRAMILNMIWLTSAVVPVGAEPAQTASLMNPGSQLKMDNFPDISNDAGPEDFQGNPAVRDNVHWSVLKATQNYPQDENPKFPEKNTVLTNAGNFGGFIITYSAVLAGHLVLYVPLGSYGAAKCVFDKEGWNDCWNGYMNKTFH